MLNLLNDLKTTVIVIKSAILIQKEVERLGSENRNLIESAINKIDKKILSLDSEFMRPRGFEEETTPTLRESRDLEGVVDDLKKQIGDLKSELKGIT